MDIGLLILRIAIGGIVAIHGAQKLLPARHGGIGIDGTTGFVDSLGFRSAKALAWLLALVELGAGLALAAGFGTPIAATLVIAVMAAAVFAVHWDKGFFAQAGGYEFPWALAMAAIALAFSGGGRYSVDHALDWSLDGPEWGITAGFLAVLASSIVTAGRGLGMHRHDGRSVSA